MIVIAHILPSHHIYLSTHRIASFTSFATPDPPQSVGKMPLAEIYIPQVWRLFRSVEKRCQHFRNTEQSTGLQPTSRHFEIHHTHRQPQPRIGGHDLATR